ncbi:MAG: transporter substrate-binding domain-containing protein [Cytophagales bacterium]|nr:transporter substrate-binding domain-containing protein [Bernardetiaceae bacterium]MDW8204891.1 transporter substrate-binding domain-containing protein [Cytophagales bacterium]
MKKLLLTSVCLLAFLQVYSQSATPSGWAAAQKSRQATIIVNYFQSPMFSYSASTKDKPKGICVDLIENFAKYVSTKKGVQVNVEYRGYDGFSKFYEATKNSPNGTFGIGSITITEARKKEVQFSPAFIQSANFLLSHNSVPTLRKLELMSKDFAGMTAYTAKNTTNAARLEALKKQYMPDMQIKYLESSLEVLRAIVQDPKGFTYLDFIYYNDALRDNLPIKRHPIGDVSNEEFGIIMPMSSDWLPIVQEFFSEQGMNYRNSNEYKKSLHMHLGESAVKLLGSLEKKG